MNDTNKPTVQGFIDFINTRQRTEIIHHGNGWQCCAVGDYLEHIGEYRDDHDIITGPGRLKTHYPELHKVLNHNGSYYDPDGTRYDVKTYGALQDFIASHPQPKQEQ